ncbi:vWA domain-containing protein [Campylobacter ureolyticus]|uniref:vWA domain-containing protein n=1 Tax=Campylobacter ureolyticus TaxID=827 RepID=UPI00046803B4|nr:VWA domain-containing protein [Campylobacter ureolyticus]
MIEFENLWAFLIPFIYLIFLKFCKQKKEAFYFSNIKMLKNATKNRTILKEILKFLLILSLSAALASPIKKDEIKSSNSQGYEIALMLDASGSMSEGNKFEIVKEILNDFIDKRKDDALALNVFADFAYTAIPLTYDKASIKRLLEKIKLGMVGLNRTALYEGLFLTSNLFKDSNSKNKIIILPTDGIDNAGTIPLDVAIKTAQKYNIKVYTVGVGRAGDFNPDVLRYIAQQTGGKYYSSDSSSGLKQIYDEIDRLEKSEIESQKFIKKTYFYFCFLGFGLFLMVVLFLYDNRKINV